MRWKKDFSAVNCRLTILLVLIVLTVYGCAGRPVKIMPEGYVRPDVLAVAWDKLVKVATLDARGVIKLETRDGQRSSQRVRFTAKSPGFLRVQWLTPWYTVAWQLLIVDREFWLSDSKGQATYHGALGTETSLDSCGQQNRWWTYIELMAAWPRMFSKPSAVFMDAGNRGEPGLADLPVAHTQYLVSADGTEPAGKIIRFSAGTEWHVAYSNFLATEDGRIFPQKLEILCPAAKLDLRLENPRINHELKEETFIYQQKNFRMKEVDCHNFLIP